MGEIMDSPMDVSRRRFLGGAAGAGAMAAAAAALGVSSVVSAEGEGNGTTDGAASEGVFGALALPPVIRGARIGTLTFADMIALNTSTSSQLQYSPPGGFTSTGWLNAPLQLAVGSRLLRVDSYAVIGPAAVPITFNINQSGIGVSNNNLGTAVTPSALGLTQGTWIPPTPYTVLPGDRLYMETTSCNSVSRLWAGAIYQYYDANPQLNLLPAPIRVYDSRNGANPTNVVKGPLANNATRVIDCTLGGAVPVDAAAAMITLTLAGTSLAGFMSLWRNGIADPGTSSINWDHNGTNVAVTTVCAVDTNAKLIAKTGPNASADFIIDVIGFYA